MEDTYFETNHLSFKSLMTDVHTPAQRSFNMSKIRARNTKPELIVSSLARNLGYRFRLHDSKLFGRPDLVFPKLKKIIFVHGCFWHMHRCSYGLVTPSTNAQFWNMKRNGNKMRDKRNLARLRRSGWSVIVVWECQTNKKKGNLLEKRLARFLSKSLITTESA